MIGASSGRGIGAHPTRRPIVADQEKLDEIEAERERRLAPENRPDNAEVDNTDKTLPTVEEWAEQHADEDQEGSAGTADPSEVFRENPPSEDEVEEIEAERERRLAPENRPDNAEVDNTEGDNTEG
jgi:hypothetical protein